MSPELIEFFEQYANDHKSPINRLTHKIAIPMIVFHIVVMLSWVKLFTIESMNGIR
ncbi:MAG: Mpo1-like protein [Bdellovibrionota bacterium]